LVDFIFAAAESALHRKIFTFLITGGFLSAQ
jgi:hypothetical protein